MNGWRVSTTNPCKQIATNVYDFCMDRALSKTVFQVGPGRVLGAVLLKLYPNLPPGADASSLGYWCLGCMALFK